jgi:hypothetical protein
MAINDRFEVKDYVDLYFLLQEFKVGKLIKGTKKKFKREMNLIMLASNLLKAEEFMNMPKMLVPLELGELKRFFIELVRNELRLSILKK